jgi:DNA repair and recombination protein RAD54B
MYRRQFVSPLLKRPLPSEDSQAGALPDKKPRLDVAQPLSNEAARTPLLNLQVPNYPPFGRPPQQEAYFNVLWRNQTTKKNKTWDGDGVLSLEGGFLTLRDIDGTK